MKTIGQRIKKRRAEMNLTQRELAKIVGVAHVTISQWENEQTAPKGENLFSLAAALKKTAAWVIKGDDCGESEATQGAVTLEPEQRKIIDLFNRLPEKEKPLFIAGLEEMVLNYEKLLNDAVSAYGIDELIKKAKKD